MQKEMLNVYVYYDEDASTDLYHIHLNLCFHLHTRNEAAFLSFRLRYATILIHIFLFQKNIKIRNSDKAF